MTASLVAHWLGNIAAYGTLVAIVWVIYTASRGD